MKKLSFIIIVIVLLLIVNNLVHSIFDLWQKNDLLVSAQKELDTQKYKNSKLKGELSFVSSQQFVDETARNKLFLLKPGEHQVLISNDLINSTVKPEVKNNLPNWQKWLNLFF